MVTPNLKILKDGKINAAQALKIIRRKPKIPLNDENARRVDQIGDIEFQNVSFKYKSREDVTLKGVSFTIEQGKTTAIVG
jgi:ATP-binding cassette subfamily B multidrug efflux pump